MKGWTLEALVLQDRRVTVAALIILCGLAWLYLLNDAGMGGDNIISHVLHLQQPVGQGMEAMSAPTGARMWLLTVAMWWVMMIAMMVPSAAPTILLYAKVYRHAAVTARASTLSPVSAFASGYLLVWLLFSIAATAATDFLEARQLPPAMPGFARPWLPAAVFIAAGIYQLSPLKTVCLAHCRSPAAFLSRHWRPGGLGALRLGVLHGAYCAGCCWVLMTLLFVGGVMNLVWIAALTTFVAIEKLAPKGELLGRGVGVLLVFGGLAIGMGAKI